MFKPMLAVMVLSTSFAFAGGELKAVRGTGTGVSTTATATSAKKSERPLRETRRDAASSTAEPEKPGAEPK